MFVFSLNLSEGIFVLIYSIRARREGHENTSFHDSWVRFELFQKGKFRAPITDLLIFEVVS